MMRGVVNARHEAVIGLRVRGPGGSELVVETVIDSGFSGSLTLPAATITALGLSRQSGGQATLTDRSAAQFHTSASYAA